jgi:hypothetical protein
VPVLTDSVGIDEFILAELVVSTIGREDARSEGCWLWRRNVGVVLGNTGAIVSIVEAVVSNKLTSLARETVPFVSTDGEGRRSGCGGSGCGG